MADYFAYWLNHAVEPRKGERTIECYRQYTTYYILPALGHVRLCDITPAMIQEFYGNMRASGRRRKLRGKPAGLSTTTVNNIHRVLHLALDWAVKWKMIAENPSDGLAVPEATTRKPVILSREQVATIVEATDNPRLRLFVMIGICTGMRRGEILGLKWSDVELRNGVLTIQHSLVDTGKRIILKSPKTDTGARPIKMPAILTDVLREHKLIQEEHKKLLGSGYEDNGLVVCWEDGRLIHPHRFYRPLRNLLARLGLPQAKLHDLRHSHATHLLEANIHPKTVSERLGHKDVETTLNIYSHLLPHIQDEAAEATDQALSAVFGRTRESRDGEDELE